MATGLPSARDRDWLRVAIDFGAGNIKIAQQHVRAGQHPRTAGIESVNIFHEMEPQFRSIMVYDQHEKVHLGQTEVDVLLKQHPEELENVLDLLKLAVCHEYRHNEAVKRIEKVLGLTPGDRGELPVMFADIFKVILEKIRSFNLSRIHGLEHETIMDYWNQIPIELQLPLPSHWDDIQRGYIYHGAKAAGFDEIVIRSETLCGAADMMLKYHKTWSLLDGQSILFLDYGCSTTGVATVKFSKDENGDLKLVEMGRSHECGAGGQSVTDEAWNKIPISFCSGDFVDFEDLRTQFGISKGEFYRQFSNAFEYCKESFPGKGFYPITVTSSAEHRSRFVTFGLCEEFMQRCFETVANKVAAMITRHLTENPPIPIAQRSVAILSGGGARNKFNRQYFNTHTERSGISLCGEITAHENHVAHGALGLYPEPENALPPGQQSFYVARAESHQARRLVHLFSSEAGSPDKSSEVDMVFRFRAGDDKRAGPRLRLNIFESDRSNLAGERVKEEHGVMLEGLKEWPPEFIDPPTWDELEERGIRPESNEDGRQFYYLTTTIRMSRRNEQLLITTRIFSPEEGGECTWRCIWAPEPKEVWHCRRSHHISNAGAPIREAPKRKRHTLQTGEACAPPRRKSPRTKVSEQSPGRLVPLRAENHNVIHYVSEATPSSEAGSVGSPFTGGQQGNPLTPATTPSISDAPIFARYLRRRTR